VDPLHDTYNSSICSTQGINDEERHSPENEGLEHFESLPYTDSTLTDQIELGSAKALDRPDLRGQRSENQGEDDLASVGNRETALTGKDDTFPPDQWKVRKIIGEEVIGGVRYYLVDWVPTLEPARNVSKDLVEEWKDQKAKI